VKVLLNIHIAFLSVEPWHWNSDVLFV